MCFYCICLTHTYLLLRKIVLPQTRMWFWTSDLQCPVPPVCRPPHHRLPSSPLDSLSHFLSQDTCVTLIFFSSILSPLVPFFILSLCFSSLFIYLCHYLNLLPPSSRSARLFSLPTSASLLVVIVRPLLLGKFSQPPHPLIFHYTLLPPHQHTHTHTPHPSLLTPLPDRPWHKCICSIPPANRLASCYQRQGDGDNGFHHIFSLLQIKMGQVAHHTHTNTHKQSPHTYMFIPKHTHTNIYTCTVESTMSKKVKKFPQIFTDITAQIQQQQHTNT